MTTPKPPIGAYVECDQPRPFDPSEERDRLAATLTPYGTTWDTHTSSMKDTARDLADPFLARTFHEMASLKVQLHNALRERDEARRANGALLWQVDNAGCTASREGETTYECRADAPCGLCRLRAERDAARRAPADAERERDEARAKATQHERDWYDAKSEFGTAMGKARARIREHQAIEAAARELLAALPRCGADTTPNDVTVKPCGALALYQDRAPYDTPYRCEEHRESSDEVDWSEAARELAARLGGGG